MSGRTTEQKLASAKAATDRSHRLRASALDARERSRVILTRCQPLIERGRERATQP